MNERIEQLAEQCWVHTNEPLFGAKSPHWEFDRHKFAELMMQECISVIQNIKPQYGDYRDQIETAQSVYCIDQIKRHFGVEQ